MQKQRQTFNNTIFRSQLYMFPGTFRRKYYKGKENPCATPSVMSKPYCEKCNKQVVWYTLSWNPRLRSCKSFVLVRLLPISTMSAGIRKYPSNI